MSLSLAAIFGAGLLTFASPCVLPLMPIYLATIAGAATAQKRPGYTLLVAAAFAAGLSSVFVALGALASSVGGWLVSYQRQIVLASAIMMILFGLRSLGVLRLPWLERDVRPGLQHRAAGSGPVGAFVFGGAFALGWSPCIGPVLASVLTYAATHSTSPVKGAFYLATYAAGLALPMLLMAAAAERAGRGLQRLRHMLPLLERLTALALIAAGGYGLYQAPREPAVADAGPTAIAAEPGSCEHAAPGGHTCALPEAARADDVAASAQTPRQGSPRLLEFTSHECPVCKRMRPVMQRLVSACGELDGLIVQVDVTTPHGRALATHHGVRGTPTYVLVDADGIERARLLGENSREDIAAAVERAFGVSCWG